MFPVRILARGKRFFDQTKKMLSDGEQNLRGVRWKRGDYVKALTAKTTYLSRLSFEQRQTAA
jgi:hypothetical protein